MDKMKLNFDDLDDRFYEIDKKVDVTKVMAEFIKKNRKDFYFNGTIEVPSEP